MTNEMWMELDDSDSEIDLDYLDGVRAGRLPRATDAYQYSGNLLACALN
jgi:hypothetical protein